MEIAVTVPGSTECDATWNATTRTLTIRPKFPGFVPKDLVAGHVLVTGDSGRKRPATLVVGTATGGVKIYNNEIENKLLSKFDKPADGTAADETEDREVPDVAS